MQKKIAASLLASFALASCVPSKNAETSAPAEVQSPAAPSENAQGVATPSQTPVATETGTSAMPTASESGTTAVPEMATGTATPSSNPVSASELPFEMSYDLGGGPIPFSGKIILKDGIVASVEVNNPQGGQVVFAKGINEEVAGKPLKGLQIDTISGASGTSKAFNEFLAAQK